MNEVWILASEERQCNGHGDYSKGLTLYLTELYPDDPKPIPAFQSKEKALQYIESHWLYLAKPFKLSVI